jgi:hypothetical protein
MASRARAGATVPLKDAFGQRCFPANDGQSLSYAEQTRYCSLPAGDNVAD